MRTLPGENTNILRSQKGYIHYFAIAAIAFVLLVGYGLFTKYGSAFKTADSSYTVFDPPQDGTSKAATYDEPIATVLNAVADIQSRLLRIKIDCITMSWDSLDYHGRRMVLQSFKTDTENQQRKIMSFLHRFDTPEWRQSQKIRGMYLAELAQSISNEQQDIIKFIDAYLTVMDAGK